MRKVTLTSALLLVAALSSASGPSTVSAIVTTPEARASYLAHARIWKDPGDLSPQDVLEGPKGFFPYSYEQATAGVDCAFARPGNELGGTTPKFLCTSGSGRLLRLKYWDPNAHDANREVFAVVAATRLLWALGFNALPALPMKVRCADCPDDPLKGKGELGTREYLAELQAYPASGPWIRSDREPGEGWSWRELDEATASLPPGPERVRQRTHCEALNLLGVFLQHGDRKPEQQALYCAGSIVQAGGEIREGVNTEPILVERPGGVACSEPAVMILDAGATFGGAGRTSNRVTAKMNLDEWRERSVFHERNKDGTCRGRLVASLAAKRDGESHPLITEAGRGFLLQQFERLSRAHIRALFTAARVNQLGDRSSQGKSADTVIDEWVSAFQQKVDEIAAARCQ